MQPQVDNKYRDLENLENRVPDIPIQCVYECDPHIKAAFIRKTYTLLSLQLLVTMGGAALFMLQDDVQKWVLNTTPVFYGSLIAVFPILIALSCWPNRHPWNLCLLGAFTLCETYSVGVLCAQYDDAGRGVSVLVALGMTLLIFISLTAYVFVTKTDFEFLGAGLGILLLMIVVWSFLQFMFGFGMSAVFAPLCAGLFSGYILYDTSQIMHRLGPDDVVMACVSLYLDILNLFLALLQIIQCMSSD